MSKFFIGDLHFSHARIIEYCERPFSTIEEMDEQLIKNWNSTVKKKDEIYVLGDVALSGKYRTEEILKSLNGTKYLISGNHDSHALNSYVKYFKWVKNYFELRENGYLWVLCHYPLYSWNKRRSGAIHLHAHTHQPVDLSVDVSNFQDYPSDSSTITSELVNRYLCVSAECIGYTPISMNEIKEKFKLK